MKETVGVFMAPDHLVGELVYTNDRGREVCQFAYSDAWLSLEGRFEIDTELRLTPGYFTPRKGSNVFFGCFADSEPDGWGRKVILRDRVKRGLGIATHFDYLLDVHDASRIGAMRFSKDQGKTFIADPGPGKRAAPPILELDHLLRAATAVDEGTETAADLRFLLERGSPLGGMRPKCTIVDEDGQLAIGKFPAKTDRHDVVRSEVLALRLGDMGGVRTANARIVMADDRPVAVIRRFDREGNRRLVFQSGRTFIGANNADETHAYTEFVDELRARGAAPNDDIEELWRRIVFTVLISNFDDHLHNHGFLHLQHGQWRLSPAFDINPAPDRQRSLKTWIDLDTGPDATIDAAMHALPRFGIRVPRAREILAEVNAAVEQWDPVAKGLGISKQDRKQLAIAFEHEERAVALREIARSSAGSKHR